MNALCEPANEWQPLHLRSRGEVYSCVDPVPVLDAPPFDAITTDRLFDDEIRAILKNHSIRCKQREWQNIIFALACAHRANTCVRYSRSNGAPSSAARRNVIECAIDRGLIREERSPSGAPHESRLVALPPLHSLLAQLRGLEPDCRDFVEVRRRKVKKRQTFNATDLEITKISRKIPHDPTHPVAIETQRKLELINRVNNTSEVLYQRYDSINRRWAEWCSCRPLHLAKFLDGFDLGGRLYADGLSHQGLQKEERRTIQFDSRPSVELDFGGCGPRMLYHLSGLEFPGDPYAVWPRMTDAKRYLAKLMLLLVVNAASGQGAVRACIERGHLTTIRGGYKMGQSFIEAQSIQRAIRETGLSFQGVYDAVRKAHSPIARYFGSDVGVRLMLHDSRIAINVLYHFALKGVPCLGVHDSFIVPIQYADELREVMQRCYRKEMNGFSPVIDGGNAVDVEGTRRLAA
jgi:hypothetical protein